MDLPKISQKKPFVQKVEPGRYSWCTCGLTKTEPFCDTTHRGVTEMRSLKIEIDEPKTVAWCGCKHTGTPPFCDGTHKTL
jgi:CDGSH-type Zn-finger protein